MNPIFLYGKINGSVQVYLNLHMLLWIKKLDDEQGK